VHSNGSFQEEIEQAGLLISFLNIIVQVRI